MSVLTDKQQIEMYKNIEVIKNNCLTCKKVQDDHETRIRRLERAYWYFVGICGTICFIINKFF